MVEEKKSTSNLQSSTLFPLSPSQPSKDFSLGNLSLIIKCNRLSDKQFQQLLLIQFHKYFSQMDYESIPCTTPKRGQKWNISVNFLLLGLLLGVSDLVCHWSRKQLFIILCCYILILWVWILNTKCKVYIWVCMYNLMQYGLKKIHIQFKIVLLIVF